MGVSGTTKVGDLTVLQFKREFSNIGFSQAGTGTTVNIDTESMNTAVNNAKTLKERLGEAREAVKDISAEYYSLSENQKKSYESISKAIKASHTYATNLSTELLNTIETSKQSEDHRIAAIGFVQDMATALASEATAESRLAQLEETRLDYIAKREAGLLGENEQFQKRLEEEIRLAKLQADREELQSGFLDDLKSELGLVGKIGETFLKYGMYTALAAMAGMVAKELFKAAKAGFELAKNSGASVAQSAQYASNIANAQLSMTGLLFGTDAVVQSAEALAKEFGDVSAASDDSIKSVTRLTAMTGDAASAVKLNKMFMAISDGTQEGADNMKNMVIETANLNGVIPEKAMKDLSQYSHEFQMNGGKSAEQMAKTLVTVNKLGLSFEGLLKTREALFDIEGSFERQMKAQVMVGKQLNIQEAQRLAMSNDMEGLAKLMVSDLGDINEFQNMGIFQQNAIAAAYGMTRDEVINMLNEEARVQTIREEGVWSAAGLKAATMGVVASTTSMAGKVGEVATKFNHAGINVMEIGGNIMKSVIPSLVKMVGLQQLSDKLTKGASNSMGGIGTGAAGMGAGLGAAVGPILLFTAAAIGLGFALKLAAPAIEPIGKAIGTIVKSIAEGISIVVDSIGDLVVKISEVASADLAVGLLATAVGFTALAGSLYLFASAGMLAMTPMAAVGAFVAAMSILSSVTGMNGNESESDNELINEIKALRNDIRSQPIVIKVNDKVVSEITRVQNVQSSYR